MVALKQKIVNHGFVDNSSEVSSQILIGFHLPNEMLHPKFLDNDLHIPIKKNVLFHF